MLRLIAIPLFIMSGLPNKPPITEKPTEPIVQQTVELDPELCCCTGIRVFHSGAVAHFGLNKTALAPQVDKRNKSDYITGLSENIRTREIPGTQSSKKPCVVANSQPGEMVSPLIVNLFF